jgi:hypothetical protein
MRFLKAWYNKTFRKSRRQAILRSLNCHEEEGKFEATALLDNGEFSHFVRAMVQCFQDVGAINYLDITAFDEATMEGYTISIQKQFGIKAADMNHILRDVLVEIVEMNRINSDEYFIAKRALNKCGYLLEDGTIVSW